MYSSSVLMGVWASSLSLFIFAIPISLGLHLVQLASDLAILILHWLLAISKEVATSPYQLIMDFLGSLTAESNVFSVSDARETVSVCK